MKRRLTIITIGHGMVMLALSSSIGACGSAQRAVVETILSPVIICTTQHCGPEEPCCNSCGIHGWSVSEAPEVRPAPGVTMPSPKMEGCVRTASYTAMGYQEGSVFFITSWTPDAFVENEGGSR